MFMTPLIVEANTKHMTLGEDRGLVHFVCETQPLTTLKTFGPPEKCPLCQTQYPTSRDAVDPVVETSVESGCPRE
jgi:hypothetical protein